MMLNATRWSVVVLLSLVAAGCGYDSPAAPIVPTPTPSSAPASIRATASSRADYTTAVVATVLTADGRFVAGIPIGFSTANGTVSISATTTDANGSASTIVTTPANTTVTVTIGALSTTVQVSGAATPPTATPPVVPPSTPSPTPSPLTVAITVGTTGTATAGTPIPFGLSTQAFERATWDFGDGTTLTTTNANVSHTYATPGTYQVTLVVTDSFGRTASTSTSVTIAAGSSTVPAYTVSLASSATSVIVGTTALLTATVTVSNGAPAVTSYAWDCDGNGTTDFTTTAPVNAQSCSYSSTGIIPTRVTATGGSVTGTGSILITVNGTPFSVSIVPSTPTTVGTSITFTATATSAGGVPATLQWQWDDTGDGVIDATDGSHASPNTRSVTYSSAGQKTMKVTVTDTATGRTGIGSVTITLP